MQIMKLRRLLVKRGVRRRFAALRVISCRQCWVADAAGNLQSLTHAQSITLTCLLALIIHSHNGL